MGVIPERKRPVTVTTAALTVLVGTIFRGLLPLIYGVSVDYATIVLAFSWSIIMSIGILKLHNSFRWFIGVMYVAAIAIGSVYYSFIVPPTTLDIIRLITTIVLAAVYLFLITTPSAREAFRKKTIQAQENLAS